MKEPIQCEDKTAELNRYAAEIAELNQKIASLKVVLLVFLFQNVLLCPPLIL